MSNDAASDTRSAARRQWCAKGAAREGDRDLVRCPSNCFQEPFEFGEDGVCRGLPGERAGARVIVLGEDVDAAH
jgi:hypothetical protein